MNKQLFTLIVKQAHKLTKIYLEKFSQYDYKAQYTIFFRMIHEVYKAKESVKQSETDTADTDRRVNGKKSFFKVLKDRLTNIFNKKSMLLNLKI